MQAGFHLHGCMHTATIAFRCLANEDCMVKKNW